MVDLNLNLDSTRVYTRVHCSARVLDLVPQCTPKMGKPNIFSHSVYLGTAVVYTAWYSCSAVLYEERLRTAQKGCFYVRNGSVMPREEGFAKQTQVMLLGG